MSTDEPFLAVICVDNTPTNEELDFFAALGWMRGEAISENGLGRAILVRQVATQEEITRALGGLTTETRVFKLLQDPHELTGLLRADLVPTENEGKLGTPKAEEAPKAGKKGDEQEGAPGEDGPAEDSEKDDEQEKTPDADEEQPIPVNLIPTFPDHVWDALPVSVQRQTAEKLVNQVLDRSGPAAWGSDRGDGFLFAYLADESRAEMAEKILKRRHNLTEELVAREQSANEFQDQRVELMRQAVASATEVNKHLVTWRTLSEHVVPMLVASYGLAFFITLLLVLLIAVGSVTGWEVALLIFVLALMAVSPATLLLVGRPLKGLDEWSPDGPKKAEEPAAEEPTKDEGKTEEKKKAAK